MTDAPIPPLSALRAFEAAARHRSLSAAARELNVTHPAIAQQVRRLEDWFGTPLMVRAGRGMEPTEAGAQLAAGLAEGFGTIRMAVDDLTSATADKPLKITLTPTFAGNWMMPRIGHFRTTHPDIELMLNPTTDIVDFVRDGYDVGFRFGHGTWPGLEAERLIESDMVVAATPALLAGRRIESPSDLLDLPWVQDLGTDELRLWFAAQGIADVRLRNLAHMPGNLMLDAVRRGEGIGITGRAWVAEDIAAGCIVTLFEEEQSPDLGYYIVTRPGVQRPLLKTFLHWVCTQKGWGSLIRARD